MLVFWASFNTVYTQCLRCSRSLGRNTELARLPIGRRFAFDTTRARLWVVCRSCDQWNLVPIEERWEALEECERLAENADVRADGAGVGLARTESGLELLRANGISDADIANARYGRRIARRQYVFMSIFVVLALVATGLGIWQAIVNRSPGFGAYFGVCAAAVLFRWWREPPRRWVWVRTPPGRLTVVWPWELKNVRIAVPHEKPPELVVPRLRNELRLRGNEAVDFLAALLPKLNGADCVDASIPHAVNNVTEAEARSRREPARVRRKKSRNKSPNPRASYRPWQWLAIDCSHRPLVNVRPETRLALEMAVMEEIERRELKRYAVSVGYAWSDEEEIAAIADDLLIAPQVKERLELLRKTLKPGRAEAEPTR